ncbi:MAG: GNAT family N-acetyltransferase [Patescibacteria group bacterium]
MSKSKGQLKMHTNATTDLLFVTINSTMANITKTKKAEAKKISEVHRGCVLVTNAKFYSPEVIRAWVKEINEENVLEQLENSEWYSIREDNKIVGFTQFDLETGVIYQMNILPEYQNKGYGKKLYQHIENILKKEGFKKIELNSSLNAINFYKKMGFKEIENIEYPSGVNEINIPEVKMEKILS